MVRLKRHIAILLLGVLLFPIVYQSAHTISHHFHEISHSCELPHTNKKIAGHVFVNSEEDTCPIIEYKIIVNQMPVHIQTCDRHQFYIEINFNWQYNAKQTLIGYKKSPRAPPYLLFS